MNRNLYELEAWLILICLFSYQSGIYHTLSTLFCRHFNLFWCLQICLKIYNAWFLVFRLKEAFLELNFFPNFQWNQLDLSFFWEIGLTWKNFVFSTCSFHYLEAWTFLWLVFLVIFMPNQNLPISKMYLYKKCLQVQILQILDFFHWIHRLRSY